MTRRRDATRREIVDAAWAVVHEHGWSGLTLRLVAERVGMRAPSLYSHFASKAAIVDVMFGEAWADLDDRVVAVQRDLSGSPREALLSLARLVVDYFTADPERHALMNQRPVPGFVPSPEAYAPSVRNLERLREVLADLGVTDPDAIDLWTAVIAGVVNQQLANDPRGDRWVRLLPRAVHMYADATGLPGTAPDRRTP